MQYAEVSITKHRSRRTNVIDLDALGNHVYINLPSSTLGSDVNYFAILAGSEFLQFALGGAYNETDPENDPLPNDVDFHTIQALGHFEADGRLFNSDIRLWIRGFGKATIIF